MRAVLYERFGETPRLTAVEDPTPAEHGVVIEVRASGVCRSDWHGWRGHDPTITLPHVPGHELAGVVAAVGAGVRGFATGDRVTVPFVAGCGRCAECASGNQQVCPDQTQPGFTHWGSFAELVAIDHADTNLVALPDDLSDAAAASLGCRFATAFRAVLDQGEASGGEWVAVHGCGGVGLSAVMIATAVGASVVAIDVTDEKLTMARSLGAVATIRADEVDDVAAAVAELTGGGAHLSLDALGSPQTCVSSVRSLRRRGRHVQVGLLLGDKATPPIPMDTVVANELRIIGSHGMQAHRYDAMLAMIRSGALPVERLLGRSVRLSESIEALTTLDTSTTPGVTVITSFDD